ncbi:transporter substrate-binding domain-containing protein [Phyllobacterium zundukense]|uniref:Transporter substrate-binding domain-containing protein n=1 Tax=Phyllobacterium zundukense TaxID=1867719 RepID=A0ACD4CVL0_9HYPH|nr:transporter substrate-binding domain-containing protein [Phyllobacterium zundukense]UXN57638.1 transporter substrate-binding domain-containing protein [Phyllobacterium zundukense]
MNKRTLMVALAASLAASLVSSSASAGAVLDKMLATKTLTVAVGTDWGKMSFLNDKHELDGYDVDVAKGVAQSLSLKIKFVTPGFDVIAAGNWQGRWDMAMGQMTPTQARAEKLAFPAVYFYERAVAVIHKDSKATKLSDINDKVVGVAAGNTQEQYANHRLTGDWLNAPRIEYSFKPSEIKTYASSNIGFDDLRLGDGVRLTAFLTDGTIADNAIQGGYPLRLLGDQLYSAPGAISILRGDKELADKIAAAIESMRKSGTLSTLSVKWYGKDYSVEK